MAEAISMAETEQPNMDEHNKAMEDKFDKAQNVVDESTDSGVPERPENVPEKFWNAETGEVNTEALLKSYSELERNRAGEDDGDDGDTADSGDDAADGDDDYVPIDFASLSDEYISQGELSEDSYAALEEAGIPKDQVDAFIEGQEAIAQLREQSAYQEAGGEESFRAMQEWAAKSLSPEDIAAFDESVLGTQAEMLSAVRDLKAKYVDAHGSEPNLVNGQNGVTSAQGYESIAQMKSDMKDPRYKTDPAFRKEVERKLAKSNIF